MFRPVPSSQPPLRLLFTNNPPRPRLPALYSDFSSQRTLNPDGYAANVSAWRRGLARLVRAGLLPSSSSSTGSRSSTSSLLVLHSDQRLLRALESKQYGRPLALSAVLREAVNEGDLVAVRELLEGKEGLYELQQRRRNAGRVGGEWSVWNLAAWTMRQLGVGELLKRGEGSEERLPEGEWVVVENVEAVGRAFAMRNNKVEEGTRFERTFSKAHFCRTWNDRLVEGKQLSEVDMEVLLTFLARDRGIVVYDRNTVKIKSSPEERVITEEDASIAQLKELLASLTHQTTLLEKRIEELTATAKQAVGKNNRIAALAAIKSKKLTEATLERRYATVHQLEEVASKIEQAADNVQLVKVMESSGEALRSLHTQVGGVERVEEVVDRLREQMAAADEVSSILAESAGVVVDEIEIDDELAALEGEEMRKVEEAKEAEEMRKRLEAIEKVPARVQPEAKGEEAEARLAEDMMSRMTLEETPKGQSA